MSSEILTGWRSVDDVNQPNRFSQYLQQVDELPRIQSLREESYRLLDGVQGQVIDVGSGTGLVVRQLAERGLEAAGVDISKTLIEVAKKENPTCTFTYGSAYDMPFDDGSIAGYRAERVYNNLDDPVSALNEAYRILKPDGRIVLLSPDLAATVFSTSDTYTNFAQAAVSAMVDVAPNGRMGTQFPHLLMNAGFKDVTATPYTLSFTDVNEAKTGILDYAIDAAIETNRLSPDQAGLLNEDMEKLAKLGAFLCTMTFFMAYAQRP